MKKRQPRFFFNLRSPYSWLATYDLTHRYPDVAAAVQWHPFWEPGTLDRQWLERAGGSFPYRTMSREKHLYILQDVRRLARERELEVRWPIDTEPRWEISHHPYFVARARGLGAEYVQRVAQARWQEGADISDPDVIAAVGAELGLDPGELHAAIDSPTVTTEATEALVTVDREGVFGVPFFILGREKYWGLDRLPNFAAAVRDTGATGEVPPVPAPTAAITFDDSHAGGCG